MSTKCSFYLKFTLYHVLKGNKPDFHNAMGGETSEQFYNDYLQELKKAYDPEKIKGKSSLLKQIHIFWFSLTPTPCIAIVRKWSAWNTLQVPYRPFTSRCLTRTRSVWWLIYIDETDSGTDSDSKPDGYIVLCSILLPISV